MTYQMIAKLENMNENEIIFNYKGEKITAKIDYTWGLKNISLKVYETNYGWFIIDDNNVYDCDCYSPEEARECLREYILNTI